LFLAESLAHDDTVFTPIELINSMLLYRLSAENKVVKIPVGAPDIPIKAMTAHGSKGLEFDYVFMPYLNDENWTGRNLIFGRNVSVLPMRIFVVNK
jgi:ATP-dependent exoDNAse (exonuclease V) beta subunit